VRRLEPAVAIGGDWTRAMANIITNTYDKPLSGLTKHPFRYLSPDHRVLNIIIVSTVIFAKIYGHVFACAAKWC
jgi:hypothetical protein